MPLSQYRHSRVHQGHARSRHLRGDSRVPRPCTRIHRSRARPSPYGSVQSPEQQHSSRICQRPAARTCRWTAETVTAKGRRSRWWRARSRSRATTALAQVTFDAASSIVPGSAKTRPQPADGHSLALELSLFGGARQMVWWIEVTQLRARQLATHPERSTNDQANRATLRTMNIGRQFRAERSTSLGIPGGRAGRIAPQLERPLSDRRPRQPRWRA